MSVTALISLRETFEASIIVCIVLALLDRIRRNEYRIAVWSGVGSGIAGSAIAGLILTLAVREMSEEIKEAYEGCALIVASGMIFWMMTWMNRSGSMMKANLEDSATRHVMDERPSGIFLLCFITTLREGLEMVFLVHATLLGTAHPVYGIAGIGIGATAAILLAILCMYGLRFIPVKMLFSVTSLLLLVLGAHLAAEGVGIVTGMMSSAAESATIAEVSTAAIYVLAGFFLSGKRS